jgi:hypothetical protein
MTTVLEDNGWGQEEEEVVEEEDQQHPFQTVWLI